MVNGNILTQIKIALDELPKSEKKVGKYILENKNDILDMNINELAEKSNTSTAAVIRLCKSLGVTGYPSLKIRLSGLIENEPDIGYSDINPNENISSIVKKMVYNLTQTIQDTSMQIDERNILDAVKIIKEVDTIYFYGVGASYLVAKDGAQKFARVGINTYAISDRHVLATTMSSQKGKAAFWGISYSGQTEEVIKFMNIAKNLKIKTISLSKVGNNLIKTVSDVSLSTARAPEAILRSSATSSRFAQLFVLDIVFMAYATSQYDKTMDMLKTTKSVIQKL